LFYWNRGGIHVVLDDAEEMALVHLVADNPDDVVKYTCSLDTRRRLQRRMFKVLRHELRTDAEQFQKRYVFRTEYDAEAQRLFRRFLDAYARITRRAVLGVWSESDMLQDLADRVKRDDGKRVVVTLLMPSLLPWISPKPIGRLLFLEHTIEKVFGTPDNFVVITNSMVMRFGRRLVQVLSTM
jgi:hypothetical protein